MRTIFVLALASVVLSACGGPTPSSDAGDDVGSDAGSDAASDVDGGVCTDDGLFLCRTSTYECCNGHWQMSVDGPCLQLGDAGTVDCATTPYERGCACTTEGEMRCRALRSSVRCTSGVWTETDHVCCP